VGMPESALSPAPVIVSTDRLDLSILATF
jgi:hypothetical protein